MTRVRAGWRPAGHLDRGTKLALVAMGLGVIVIANDFTALNVALPAMEQDFDVDVGTIQWTVNAYVLVFGMGLVTGGRLADMLGRRKIFFIGTAIFAAFSLARRARARAPPVLIGARVGMGVGGALMWPAVLGMTFAALPAGRAGLAGGLVLGVAGLGNALGPLIGGVLTDELSWRAIFWLNLPIAAFARPRDGEVRPPAAGRGDRAADRLRRDRHRLRRAGRDPARARPGGRLGLDRRPRAGDVRRSASACWPRSR